MPNVQTLTGGFKELETASGATIRVETENALTVIVDGGGQASQRITLPYPDAGYGGHELLLSKDETYLVIWLYSGQSEVGYELFRYRPTLKHIASFPYVGGEGYGPAFSSDERFLAMAWTVNFDLQVDDEDALENNVTARPYVLAWVEVHLRVLADDTTQTCRVDVRLPKGLHYEGDDGYFPRGLAVSATEVTFRADWGVEVRIPLPLPEVVVVEGPTTR